MKHNRYYLQSFPKNGTSPSTFIHLPACVMPRFLAKAHTICSNVRSLPKNYGSRNQPIDTLALLSSYPCSSENAEADDEQSIGKRFLKSRCSESNITRYPTDFVNQYSRKYYGFLEPIPSVASPEFEPMVHETSTRRTVSVDSADSLDFKTKPYVITESYYNYADQDLHSDKPPFRASPYISNKGRTTSRRYSREPLKLDIRESVDTITEGFRSNIQLSPFLMNREEESEIERDELKEKFEGKVVPPEASKKLPEKNPSNDIFERCLSSATSNDALSLIHDDEEMVDEVFDTSIVRKKKPIKKTDERIIKTVLNSLEALPSKKVNKLIKKRHSSSVSIEENPKIIVDKTPTKSSNIASSNVIAKSNSKPVRGSLKKSSKKTSTSSDYDRDRGRSRHIDSGHRESFKKNDRTNERGSDQDRDASDREHKDGSLNRSLSNTDTNLEDRIGLYQYLSFN